MEIEDKPLDAVAGGKDLPNSTAVLVLGILSIPGCCCYGLAGLVMSIVALALAAKDIKMYRKEPHIYKASSFNNLEAGRICAIVGLVFSGIYFIIVILEFFLSFAFLSWSALMDF